MSGTTLQNSHRAVEETSFETGKIRDEILPKPGIKLGGDCTWRRHYKELFEAVEWWRVEETEKLVRDVGCTSKIVTCAVKLPLCFYVASMGQSDDMLRICPKQMHGENQREIRSHLDAFIKRTEAIENAVATYKFMSEAEKALLWLKIANLFSVLRFMMSRWGLTELCKAFLSGCGNMISAIEEAAEDINEVKGKMEAAQKKWTLNAKFQKVIDERDERRRRKAKEEITIARRNEVSATQASTLRVHIEASISTQRGTQGTQASVGSPNGSTSDLEAQTAKRRKMDGKPSRTKMGNSARFTNNHLYKISSSPVRGETNKPLYTSFQG